MDEDTSGRIWRIQVRASMSPLPVALFRTHKSQGNEWQQHVWSAFCEGRCFEPIVRAFIGVCPVGTQYFHD